MSYLLYCIFADTKNQPPIALPGIDGRSVEVVSHSGLSTAVSAVSTTESPVSVGMLQRFENVIAANFARQAVIPLRYGNVVADKSRIGYHLKENALRYHRLLSELDGLVEMGIRILIADNGWRHCESGEKVHGDIPLKTRNHGSGRAYLNQRKALYNVQDRNNPCVQTAIEQYRSAFSDIFVKFKSENGMKSSRRLSLGDAQPGCCNTQSILSLFFLVPCEELVRFKEIFRRLGRRKDQRMMLSGPWPPYNFVVDDYHMRHLG